MAQATFSHKRNFFLPIVVIADEQCLLLATTRPYKTIFSISKSPLVNIYVFSPYFTFVFFIDLKIRISHSKHTDKNACNVQHSAPEHRLGFLFLPLS